MTLEQVSLRKHPLAECESCPLLHEGVFVPSDGPEKAQLVLVGEAPGREEARGGKPFVGLSGKLLDQILPSVGLKREDVFITNTCLCRPRDNSNPPAAAVRACHDRLVSEVEERDPRVIVALGNFASKAILDTQDGITKTRVGPPKHTEVIRGDVVVIPTFHPAASLYNSGVFPDIITDFEKIPAALARSSEGSINVAQSWHPPEIITLDDIRSAEEALRDVLNGRSRDLAIDIEVGIEKDTDLGRPDRQHILCIGLSTNPGTAVVVGEGPCQFGGVQHLIGQLLESKAIIAQNGKFDMAGLYNFSHQGALNGLAFDTMLAHYCLDERQGTHSLDQLAVSYLGSPDWKTEFRRLIGGGSYANAPRDLLYKYNGYDVSNTFLLKDVFQKELEREGLTKLHEFLVRTSPTLMRAEMVGVTVDLGYNQELERESLEILNQHLQTVREIVENGSHNPNSWQQTQRVLKNQFRKRVKDTRAPTIALLQETAARVNDMALYYFCESHLAFKKESKSYGTYIKGIRKRVEFDDDGRGRVYADFLLHGTVSGRLSSRDPNLQNITRGSRLRRQFIPQDTDHVFVQADYRQAELRVVCCMARDAYLREVFADEERDIHSEVARRFYGDTFTKEQRVRAKAVVFGLTYGREAFSLAAEYRMSVKQAQEYIDEFFQIIPDTVNWIQSVEASVLDGDDLISVPYGRHRRFWLITDKNRNNILKEARATLPQAGASDITLEAANRIARMGYWDNFRIPVHDSLLFEVHRNEAEEFSHMIKEVMEETAFELMEGYVPFPVDVVSGTNWGDLG